MPEQFYFPIPDNRIAYDCRACGYKCCKGGGFSIAGPEIEALFLLKPELKPFAYTEQGELGIQNKLELINFSQGCFLLRKDGSCEVEKTLGRTLKPWVCRLYPMNEVNQIGDYFVFNFHVFGNGVICPFTIQSEGRRITYRGIEADLQDWQTHPAREGASHCEELDRVAGKLIQTETKIRDKLSKMPKGSRMIDVLAIGTELTASQCRRRISYFEKLFKLTSLFSVDEVEHSEVLASFIPSVRMKYLTTFYRQGYTRAKEQLPDFVFLSYLFSATTARLLSKPLSGDLLLTVCTKMRGIFHLASLLDRKVVLDIPEEETVPFPIDSPISLGLMHLLRKKDPRAFWHIIGDSLSIDSFEIGDSIPHLGSLDPLAPFLHSLSH